MMKMKKVIFIMLFGAVSIAKAQIDPHFSQYYMHPLWLNPALTGAINGDYRVAIIDRNQWSGVTNAFSSQGLMGDIATDKNINFGLSLMQQSAGDAGYKYFNGLASVSYSGIRFGKDGLKVISFGMSAGLVNRRFDFSKAYFGNQYTQYLGFDPTKSSGEHFGKRSSTTLDLGVGAAYYDGDPEKKVNYFGGFSAAHINQAKDNFVDTSINNGKVPMRLTLHGGARILLSDRASVVPNALIMKQAGATEVMLGGYLQMAATDDFDVMGGINYRVGDAFYPYVGINFNSFIVGFSYDINASKLGAGAKASSYEFSLMYSNKKATDKGYFKCPRF